jgi:magnesium-transporting ATPase (P-type)
MGITGTDVSKDAAEMVLADDNFATIVFAVQEGRRVWDNLVKVLLYNMPVNFAQGLSVFFAYVLFLETVPLTAIQVLYVNMITSVTMGLMLAMEPAEIDIMERPPRRKGKRLFGKMVAWHCIYVSSILIVSVIWVFQYQLHREAKEGSGCIANGMWLDPTCKMCTSNELPTPKGDSDIHAQCPVYCKQAMNIAPSTSRRAALPNVCQRVKKARAGAFNMLVFGEIAYALNCRFLSETSLNWRLLTGNKWAWISIFLTAALQVCLHLFLVLICVFLNAAHALTIRADLCMCVCMICSLVMNVYRF